MVNEKERCYHLSFPTSKHGHSFVHSIGSTSPFPFTSGLKSRCPTILASGYSIFRARTNTRNECRCHSVRVSFAIPWQSKPPS